ncbi:hypothetical protein [Streptomyces sp. NBC_00390]|uniref:hypothetical protein n=1 Tax=Streptomyces sp. NBC_00390 TaxID=2975736 RepID=UPI003FCDFA69
MYDRETEWAPPHFAGQLREVGESLADAERESLQKYIHAMEAETPERQRELEETVEGYEALTVSLSEDRKKSGRGSGGRPPRSARLRRPLPVKVPLALEVRAGVATAHGAPCRTP